MELLISWENLDPCLCAHRSDWFIHRPLAVSAAPGEYDKASVGSISAKHGWPTLYSQGLIDGCPSQTQKHQLVFPPLRESGSD